MRRATAVAIGMLGLLGTSTPASAADEGLCVLLFSRTEGFRHGSIDAAVPALEALGAEQGWVVDATEDPTVFTPEGLAPYDVVVFLLTTGDVLDPAQQDAFEAFIADGRGYVGVHSATDTEYDWPWYGELLGGYFDGHPSPQDATVVVVDPSHESTAHLGAEWMRFDEWYNFAPNPTATVEVLLELDEQSYRGGTMGDEHPIAWTHEHGGGRAFYTGGGHTDASYAEPAFMEHLAGGILWAAGEATPGETTGTGTGGGGDATTGLDSTGTGAPPATDGDSEGSGTATPGSGTTSAPTPPESSTGSAASGTTGGQPGADDPTDAGCACRSHDDGPRTWGLSLLALIAIRRRR